MLKYIISSLVCTGLALLGASETNPDMKALLERFKKIDDLTHLVQREYVTPVEREALWNNAFRGMLQGLDPYSRFLDKREILLRQQHADGLRKGFGFDWRFDPAHERTLISRIVEGSSADHAGLVPGDVITSINGHNLTQKTVAAIRSTMLSLPDPSTITVIHADGTSKQMQLTRTAFTDSGVVHAHMINTTKGIGYVRINRFLETVSATTDQTDLPAATEHAASLTARAMRHTLKQLQQGGLKALIIDLRGNAGGSVKAGIEVADMFLNAKPGEQTLIASQISRNPRHQHEYEAHSSNTLPHWPMAVLIDQDTASSAEIVAAALQDHKRAVIVGHPSQGKDVVQQQFILDDNSAILLTVAQFRTPSGRMLNDGGITPDIHVSVSRQDVFTMYKQRRTGPFLAVTDPVRDAAVNALLATLIHQSQALPSP